MTVLFGCLLTTGSAALAPPVQAQSTGRWTLEPSSIDGSAVERTYFDYTLTPGSAIQDFVRLANGTDHDITFTLYAADAYTTEQGSFALRLRTQPREGVGAWVSLPFTTRTVAAGSVASFPFQLGVPADTSPGDWAGGIVALSSPSGPTANGLTIEQGNGVRVFVRVKGSLHPSLAVTRFDGSVSGGTWSPFGQATASFTYVIANDGNVRLAGTAQLEVTDAFGRTVKQFPGRQLPELLPGDTNTVTETWDAPPAFGLRLYPRLTVRAPDVEISRSASALWHVPVSVVLTAIAGIVAVAFAVRAAARLRHRSTAVKPTVVAL